MKGRLTSLAVLVPVLGLAVLVGRAEYAVRGGPVWTIPIDGHDPRDLLHGQYLRYQYRLHWQGRDSCGFVSEYEHTLAAGCCLCLTHAGSDGFDPYVRQIQCGDPKMRCEGVLRTETMMPPLRHFVPELRAQDLEAALRTHDAAIELVAGPTGEPAVRELLLDRRPWREVLGR